MTDLLGGQTLERFSAHMTDEKNRNTEKKSIISNNTLSNYLKYKHENLTNLEEIFFVNNLLSFLL